MVRSNYSRRSLSGLQSRRLATTRRRFLQGSAAALAGVALSNCRSVSDVQGTETGESESVAAANGGSNTELRVYTWADYTDDELAQRFEEETGYSVTIDIYDSNETMLAKMLAGGGDAYSIIYPSDYMVEIMRDEHDMLMELDKSQIKGMEQLGEKWQSPVYDPNNTHSVPISWGTTGLLFNTELVSAQPEDWTFLWDNQEELARRMTLLDDVRETMGATLRSLGYSYNSTDPAEIEEAYERLRELKPALASFQSFGWEDQLVGGDLIVAMSYSVDAIAASLENPVLNYIVPQSGSSVWTDTMVIPKAAPNPEAAYAWINFMLRPEISARAVERLTFATPVEPAFEMLPEELKQNDKLFPSEDVLARCEGIAPVGDAAELYDQYWTELTSA
jgi:spermidine/putrescine transport system substrate-binding protein